MGAIDSTSEVPYTCVNDESGDGKRGGVGSAGWCGEMIVCPRRDCILLGVTKHAGWVQSAFLLLGRGQSTG